MRVFAVILALAVLSGCHARSVPEDDWNKPWEDAVEKINDYFTDLNSKADKVVTDFRSSQISRELDTLIQNRKYELGMFNVYLQTELAPYIQEAAGKLNIDLEKLTNKLSDHMSEAWDQMEKYCQEQKTWFQSFVCMIRDRV